MSFSENIKKYRAEAKLTQEELAQRVGISAQAVSKWETSDTFPDTATLPDIADALGVSIDSLFGHEVHNSRIIEPEICSYIKHGDEGKPPEGRMFDVISAAYKSMAYEGYSRIWDELCSASMSRIGIFTESAAGVIFDNPQFAFSTMLLEPEGGFGEMFTDEATGYLGALGDPDVIKCVYELLKAPGEGRSRRIELALLLRNVGIDFSKEAEICEKLRRLVRIVGINEVEIDGVPRIIIECREFYAPYLLNIIACAYAASHPSDVLQGGEFSRKSGIIK